MIPFVMSMITKHEALTLDDVYNDLVSYEAQQLQHQAEARLHVGNTANYAGRGGTSAHGGHGGPPLGPSHGSSHGGMSRGRGHGASHGCNNSNRPECPIYGKIGHSARKCWYHMVESYSEDPHSTTMAATSSYQVDPNWYSDMGATDHITSDLDRLAIREKYHGPDTVQVSNGAGLQILHLGSCSINTNTRPLALNNVLHVPEISKHLLSIHKLVCDNNIFFKFHPW
jgi:hypothetical protein